MSHLSKYFNVRPQKIVLVGDSAGGNLVLALALWCAKYGFRPPDGVVPLYPCNSRKYAPT